MKEIVVYFSRNGNNWVKDSITDIKEGNTEFLAEYIQGKTFCDVLKIETIKDYSNDYYEAVKEAKEELDNKIRPELSFYLEDIEKYERIYLGYPIWHDTCPMAVLSLLEKSDFSDKIIIPFCTHEGSGIANSINDIKKATNNAIIKDCFETRGYKCQSLNEDDELKSKLDEWLEASKS